MPSRGMILVDLALSIVEGQHDVVPGRPAVFEYSASANTEIENVNSANSNSVLAPLTNVDYNIFKVMSKEFCSDSSDSVAENAQNNAKTQIEVNQASNVSIENETLITEQVMRKSRKRIAQRQQWKRNINKEELRNLKECYDQHIENKDLSRKQKADDIARATEKSSIIVACYDLQVVFTYTVWRYFDLVLWAHPIRRRCYACHNRTGKEKNIKKWFHLRCFSMASCDSKCQENKTL
ncbi:hypothetical protein ILUMI_25899 [Ignelater luminosus]|uniref:Uncharacterized protein n=1 Tax=Ignelater luminosus TaxID=2038154 RepID=A0A8K0FZ72_IGNLU|nr:hypothetical protein ILUMI_25899 [Ignelater luminosus]